MTSRTQALLAALPNADETLQQYIAGVIDAVDNDRDLVDQLAPLLVEYQLVPSIQDAETLLHNNFTNSVTAATTTTATKKIPTTSTLSPPNMQDDWGTKTLPNQNITNVIVDRIETPQERARRERKEQKDLKKLELEQKKEDLAIEKEKSVGVAQQVTSSIAVTTTNVKKSNGDIHLTNVSMSVGAAGKDLLRDATVTLIQGAKYALIGRNGVGKSTFLTKLARRELDGFPQDLSVLYVAQEVAGSDFTAVEVVLRADGELHALREEEKRLENNNGSSEALAKIHQRLADIDADSAEPRARAVLAGLGFTLDMQNAPTKNLSGGWRMRASLASALFASPDLLLLDEPTNGLSLDAIVWLEDYIANSMSPKTTLICVSHDRVFLNAIVNWVILFEQQTLQYFKGDIDVFDKTRKQKNLQQTREREATLGKIAHMQKFVDRFRYNAKRASLAQSRLKAISRLESVMADEIFQEPEVQISFPDLDETETGLGVLLQAENVAFKYPVPGSEILFSSVDFNLSPGSKVVLLGPNGKGKSTFLKVLAGELDPTQGSVKRHSSTRMATFAQHHLDILNPKQTPLDFMLNKFPGTTPVGMRPHLARYGVTAELAEQRIGTLSGGQKARVALALVTYLRPNVLLLDEPTSHLDMESSDALVMACASFEGALLVISHDQSLISCFEDIWVLEKKRIVKLSSEFAEYKQRLLMQVKKGL